MAVYKEEKTNTWRAVYRYTDWNGERKQTQKRGFKTKREAQAWEREQLNKATADLDMTFKSFVDLYTACLLYTSETISSPQSSQYQAGIRWPHHSWREMHQSLMFSIQL